MTHKEIRTKTTIEILAFLKTFSILIFLTSGLVLAIDRYVDNNVGCGGNSPCYDTIQAAIDDAGTGDTIKVANGTYTGSGNRTL